MSNWKEKLRVNDIDDKPPIEMVCKSCGKVRYLQRSYLLQRGAGQLYLSEVEKRARCIVYGCNGKMRMAMTWLHKISGWVGGMP